jgi:hypothetical protein
LECDSFGASTTTWQFSCFLTKNAVKEQLFMSTEDITAKVMSTGRNSKKMVSRNASKSFTNIVKSVTLPKRTSYARMLCK